MVSKDLWAGVGSALAFLVTVITMAMNQVQIKLLINKISNYLSQYTEITIPEYGAQRFQRSDFFIAVEAYLSDKCAQGARKLKAELGGDQRKPQISVDDEQEITDTMDGGAAVWWYAHTELPRYQVISTSPGDEKRRFYRLVFHKKFRQFVQESYLPDVVKTGRDVISKNRQRRLFTNNPSSRWSSSYYYYQDQKTCWSHVAFQHPASFDTLAMDPDQKEIIKDELIAFKHGDKYYAKVGKPWKRGYLLFGPPGTGKSTMIAAIANFLEYDIYDLELTAVNNNTELRKLFIETTGKSIIVIEDIDRSVDLTDHHKRRGKKKSGRDGDNDMMTLLRRMKEEDDDDATKQLTLSGLLNFIDGLWSACGGERIIIFTTNNKDKLDPALIRTGRMDRHIEMSYCRYEAFKVLASNYLDIITITEHQMFVLFGEIQQLLEEVDMTPADVAGYLMRTEKRNADACLKDLVGALKKAKHDAAGKQDDEAKAKEELHGE